MKNIYFSSQYFKAEQKVKLEKVIKFLMKALSGKNFRKKISFDLEYKT